MKKTLWIWRDRQRGEGSYAGQPHIRNKSPFCHSLERIDMVGLDTFLSSSFFSVVRNPFVRVLSAYLDKVASNPRDLAVWQPFARRFRLAGDARPSFSEFLCLLSTERPDLVDQHFSPQYVNIHYPLISPDFVGRLEVMDEAASFLAKHNLNLESHAPHKTNSEHNIDKYYGEKEVELVKQYYEKDFEMFGYSDDPGQLKPIRPVKMKPISRESLRVFVEAYVADKFELRKKFLDELRKAQPELEADYIALDANLLSQLQIKELGDRAIRGEIDNWRFASKIAQELIKYDMIDNAASVLQRANAIMNRK